MILNSEFKCVAADLTLVWAILVGCTLGKK